MRLVDADATKLRFEIGERVECNCGQWKPGTVVKLFYVQKKFPKGMCVPYQVKLDDGKLIFAPDDVDRIIRKLLPLPVAARSSGRNLPEGWGRSTVSVRPNPSLFILGSVST